MKEILEYLFTGKTLTRNEACKSLIEIGKGMHSDIEFSSFLTVFKMRNITSEELAGFRDAMTELCMVTDLSEYNAIDIVGTGGDNKNTFNISTLACFLIAGTGINVAKHGNYAVSSTSGSSNILELLGYKFTNDPNKLKNDLNKGNFCFMHAPLFHPAMKHIAPVRKKLKVQTFFNILGPMINPSLPKYQVIGVNNTVNFKHYKNIYKTLNINYIIINNCDGYDEISLTAPTHFAQNNNEGYYTPLNFGLKTINPKSIYGGKSIKEAANIFMNILKGKGTDEQNSVVIANAAIGINLINGNSNLKECALIAEESLKSGKALEKLYAVTK